MTDEEKALEYADENIDIAVSMYNPNAISLVKQAYLDGLTKGREEGYEQGMKKVCEMCEQHMLRTKNV